MVRIVTSSSRLRGLRQLVSEAVDHGATAVETVHLATTSRTFRLLSMLPIVAEPSEVIHVVHDAWVSGVYGAVRVVNRVVGKALDVALDVAERQ